MANKYNAFISYRHAPEDIKIASEVQRSLERFKIPPAIQQKTGIKRFERVFRDKEELPITADLNDDIDEAIKNSDNLIVICSTRTSESIWVRKEIETFLKYHTKKEIFTVLVDGEPEDVIPDILQHDTITIKKADGTTETKEALIEPLSCDYRIGIKKARKVELPRLAASLLGCSYDELVQRRRQYERRRNAIIGTISTCAGLCVMAYLVWSLLQIRMNYDLAQQNYQLAQDNYQLAQVNYETAQANYEESLRNQSEYLATVSGQLLAKDDRVNAVLLALAALPSEGNDRPVTTRAEYALSNALGCYLSPGAYSMIPIWNYSTPYNIQKYLVTQDQKKLIALDSYGDITIWNLKDHSLYKIIPRDGVETQDFAINREGVLIINYREKLVAYDETYENVLWSMELDSDHKSYSYNNSIWAISEGEEILYKTPNHVMVLDTLTGEVKLDLDIEDVLQNDDSFYQYRFSTVSASQDGRWIALSATKMDEGEKAFTYDRDSSEWIPLSETFWHIDLMKFTSDNELMVSYEKEDLGIANFSMGSVEILSGKTRTISKFDINSGKELWGVDIDYTLSSENTQMLFSDFGNSGEERPAVIVLFSNKLYILELDNGKVLSGNELTGEHIASYLTGDGSSVIAVLKSGKYLVASLTSDSFYMGSYELFQDKVSDVNVYYSEEENDNHFLIKYSDQPGIIEYDKEYCDDSYEAIEGIEAGEILKESMVYGDKVLLFGNQMNLYCFDSSTGTVEWKKKIEGDNYASVSLVCIASDGMLYLINKNAVSEYDRHCDKLFMVDIADGSISLAEGVPCSSLGVCYVDDKIIISALRETDDSPLPAGIYIYDCVSHTSERMDISDSDISNYLTEDFAVSPDGKKAILISSEWDATTSADAYVIDLETATVEKISCLPGSFAAWDPTSSIYAIGCGTYVNLYDITDGKFLTIPKGDSEITSIALCDKGLITYSQRDTLSLYDLEGNMIGNTQLEGNAVSSTKSVTYKFLGDELIVSNSDYDSIIDMHDFEIRISLCGLTCYDSENGRFYVKTYDQIPDVSNFVYYERYSLEELIERGHEFVGSETLSDELKSMYGIS